MLGSKTAVADGTYEYNPKDNGGIRYGLNVYDELENRGSTENFRSYFMTYWRSHVKEHPRNVIVGVGGRYIPWTSKGCHLKCKTVKSSRSNFYVHADGNTITMRYD